MSDKNSFVKKCHTPRLAEPVAHDGHHAGPDGGLQQAVHHPQAAVQIDVVDVEPFGQSAKHKLLQIQCRGNKSYLTEFYFNASNDFVLVDFFFSLSEYLI